ncbi:hypothetical protein [Ancylomarina longa]|uniref:DUF975 family protein n=1 Tax=Ancylomarina longa TaxID=2487017 RepID=A0A434AT89_9BACT|nr:hypothetical protein [Ancylomarina longa]RUT77627.1 hypothetical protein DLK05_11895 [Ancylomarina longa]
MKIDYCAENMILKVYPTVGGCFQEAWRIMKKYFLVLFLAIIVASLLDAPMGYKQYFWQANDSINVGLSLLGLLGFVYYIIVATPISYGVDWLFLQAARDQNPLFEDIFFGFRKFLFVILSHLLVIGLVGMGFVLLIIPGIYLAIKLIFVPFLIMDKKVDPIQAVKLSYYLSKGYFWTIFGMAILSLFIIILGVICFIIGVFVSLIWIHVAFAILYKAAEELHFKEACELAGVQLNEV